MFLKRVQHFVLAVLDFSRSYTKRVRSYVFYDDMVFKWPEYRSVISVLGGTPNYRKGQTILLQLSKKISYTYLPVEHSFAKKKKCFNITHNKIWRYETKRCTIISY